MGASGGRQESKRAEEQKAGQASTEQDPLGDLDLDPPSMTVAELQAELAKRGLETKWNPLRGKKGLQDRLSVRASSFPTALGSNPGKNKRRGKGKRK